MTNDHDPQGQGGDPRGQGQTCEAMVKAKTTNNSLNSAQSMNFDMQCAPTSAEIPIWIHCILLGLLRLSNPVVKFPQLFNLWYWYSCIFLIYLMN